jgi:hypothetical protein
MSSTNDPSPSTESDASINWLAIAAVYAALAVGLGWMLYWGDYRNVAWLSLIGTGGGLTLYGRVLEARGESDRAGSWKLAGAAFYLVLLVWAGWTLL